jgi:hypothetical protein
MEKDGDQLDRSMKNGVKEERNLLYVIKRRKDKWSGQILLRNCLLKHLIEGTKLRT